MDKEKEIKKLKLIIAENMATYSKAKMPYDEALKMCALGILGSGYGNVKQAVKEFAEKLKEELWKFDGSWQEYDGEELCETVDNLTTELYGADE